MTLHLVMDAGLCVLFLIAAFSIESGKPESLNRAKWLCMSGFFVLAISFGVSWS